MLKPFRKGDRFTIFFWEEENGSCEAEDYLNALAAGGHQQQSDFEVLVKRRIEFMADNGPNFRGDECHKMENSEVAFEFKAANGARLGWFYSPMIKGVVICSHGFHKPVSNKAYKPHIERIEGIQRAHVAQIEAIRAAQNSSSNKGKQGKKKK